MSPVTNKFLASSRRKNNIPLLRGNTFRAITFIQVIVRHKTLSLNSCVGSEQSKGTRRVVTYALAFASIYSIIIIIVLNFTATY